MKKALLFLLFLNSFAIFSQDVNFKKGIVYVDGKECMKYDSGATNVTFQNMNGDDIMILKFLRPDGTQSSLYVKVIFIESRQELTSKSYIFTKKLLVEKLLKSNALQDCALNEEKVGNFVLKFDEKIEDRVIVNPTNTVIIKEEPRGSGININIGR